MHTYLNRSLHDIQVTSVSDVLRLTYSLYYATFGFTFNMHEIGIKQLRLLQHASHRCPRSWSGDTSHLSDSIFPGNKEGVA